MATIDTTEDAILVRECLRSFARELQLRGELPADVPEADLDTAVEQHVAGMVAVLQRHPSYAAWKRTGHLKDHMDYLVRRALKTTALQQTALARDQISYLNPETGASLTPTWQHRNCGGRVYVSEHGFRCQRCHKTGQLGADVPKGLSRFEQMEYVLLKVREVDLN